MQISEDGTVLREIGVISRSEYSARVLRYSFYFDFLDASPILTVKLPIL